MVDLMIRHVLLVLSLPADLKIMVQVCKDSVVIIILILVVYANLQHSSSKSEFLASLLRLSFAFHK